MPEISAKESSIRPMSSYFRPDPLVVVFPRFAETDLDGRRPELFFFKKNPPISYYASVLDRTEA